MLMPIILPAQKWNPDYTISTNYFANTEANNGRKIAISRNGIIHAVWQEANLTNDEYRIIYSRSTDYGETWTQGIPLSPSLSKSYFPAIAVSGDTIHVVWILKTNPYTAAGALYYSRSINNGIHWEEPTPLDLDQWNDFPTITVVKGGVTIVWDEFQYQIKAKHSRNQGTDWEDTQILYTIQDEINYEEPSIAYSLTEDQPIIHVTLGRNFWPEEYVLCSDILYIRSNDGGINWETGVQLRGSRIDNRYLDKSTIAANGNLVQIAWTVHVPPWLKQRPEGSIKHITSEDYGIDWSEVYTIASSSGEFFEINLSIDNANLVHLIWVEYVYDIVIKYKRYMNGYWQQTYNLYVCDNVNPYPTMAILQDITNWNKENGIYILWSDYGILKFKRGWQIGENASYPNQGRHLDRTVNTTNCYSVFQGEKALFWQSRNNQNTNPPVAISDGKYPSVAVTSEGSSWICYTTEVEHGQQLKCSIKRSKERYDWKETPSLFDAESIFAPSLVFATTSPGAPGYDGNLGYVVYTTKDQEISNIHFSAFDSGGVYYDTILDSGSGDISVSAPSIAITPADYIHIVWQREEQGGDVSRIYYVTTLDAITPDDIRHGREPRWSELFNVSYFNIFPTEPASNPFVDAYGERVYVVWKGPNEDGNPIGEIWQRSGQIWPGHLPIWGTPRNVSESPEKESDYPVQSTSNFVAWQEYEHGNWEIKLRYKDDLIRNITQTETDSKYPHINVKYNGLEAPVIYFIWTETVVPDRLYEVRFLPYNYGSGRDNTDELIYYSVNPGSSTQSTYCEHRDGYIPYPNYPIDFGNQSLSYRLDYLNPAYHYKAKAIVYHNAAGPYRQIFSFDSTSNTTIAFQPGIPETVEVIIPKNSYRQDFKSILRVTRNRGNFSSLASFDICQFEINDTTGSGSGAQSTENVNASLISFQNFPNPFKTNTKIRFSLAKPTHVSLKIYNSNGQLIRTLLNETKETGTYNIVWDGRDKQNRLLTAGVYFYRLETNGYLQTKKVVFTR
jgi:hypothetical protein